MTKGNSRKIIILFGLTLGFMVASHVVSAFWSKEEENIQFEALKTVTLIEDDLEFEISSQAKTVEEFLEEQNIKLVPDDKIFPLAETNLYPNSTIIIQHAQHIELVTNRDKIFITTLEKNLESAILHAGILMDENDILAGQSSFSKLSSEEIKKLVPFEGLRVELIEVSIREEVERETIAFKTILEEDASLGWREKKIVQKGKAGSEEITYQLSYHNSKEVSRKIIRRQTIEDPAPEKIVQGTKIILGDSHKGQATWYSNDGGLTAASPWLPMGSYAKVTSRSSGTSVIVKINDRGPFGKGRIIDLEKAAFSKIAPLGAGVIEVKVEEILN